ncbi:MAG TPA: response regulator [Acetobacteraceae bacterium]
MADRPHILVVEDDPLVSELLLTALEEDYQVTGVETAALGYERLRAGGVDLLLLDCTLPGGLGDDLIPEADRVGVPVVLMSGNPELARGIPGNRRFVSKPFALSALLDLVGMALRS